MKNQIWVIVLLVFSAPALATQTAPLKEPVEVELKCSFTQDEMREVIKNAGALRGWKVIDEEPGRTKVRYIKGNNKHILTLYVYFSDHAFRVRYESSEGLQYYVVEEGSKSKQLQIAGQRRINSHGNMWMKNLSEDIRKATRNICRQSKP